MTFSVQYTPQAVKELKNLDKHTRTFLLAWIEKNLVVCIDPRRHGKSLTANRSGQWRYRIGNYRLIAEIEESKVIILLLSVGHRRDIYY